MRILGYTFLILLITSCGGGGGGEGETDIDPNLSSSTVTPTTSSACSSAGGAPNVSQQLQWPHYSSDEYSSRYLDTDKLKESNFSNCEIPTAH